MKSGIQLNTPYRLPALELQVADADLQEKWVQLAYEGEWKGHPNGPFKFDSAVFEELVENFKARKVKIPIDYEHASGLIGVEARASGWILDLRTGIDDEGRVALFGLVKWTEPARQHIRLEEYKYLSPTIIWTWKDPKTGDPRGALLFAAALTNTPFLDELPELTLSVRPRTNPEEQKMEEHIKAIMAKLNLPADTAPEKVVEAVGEIIEGAKKTETALEARQTSLKEVYGRLELKEDATDKEAIAAVVALKKPAVTDAPDRVTVLETQLKEQQALLLAQKVDAAINAAQRAGKLAADDKSVAWARDHATKDFEGFSAFVECAAVIVPVDQRQHSPEMRTAKAVLTPEETSACKQLGLTEEEFRKHNPVS